MIDEALLLQTACELVSIPSPSGEEERVAAHLSAKLERLGFDVELQEVQPRRSNVIARLELPEPGPALLFNGHLDTLPVDPKLPRPFDARVEDGRLHGAGVVNMKGAVAAMVAASHALAGSARCGRIVLSAVIGECDALGLGTAHALDQGLTADACINGEPTELRILSDHAGVTQLDVRLDGREVHVYEIELGANAILAMADVIHALESLRLEPGRGAVAGLPIVNVGVIGGGRWHSLTAGRCTIGVDVRGTGEMTPDSIRDDVERAVTAAIAGRPGITVDVALRERPAFVQQHPFRASAEEPIVRAVAVALERELGRGAEFGPHWPESCYGTDASHIARAGIPTVICGPGSHTQISRPDEHLAVAELVAAARIYAAAGLEYLRGAA
jgi:acetylornithine deacetylase/succinyl-diaminopimelate desuccinylase-like protein